MQVNIDRGGCISCGLCEATCPAVFRIADDGVAEVHHQPADDAEQAGAQVLFFIGYFTAAALGLPGGGSAGVGGIGFALGLVLAVLWDRRVRKQQSISFRITAIAAGD